MYLPARLLITFIFACLGLLFLVGCFGSSSQNNPGQVGIVTDLTKDSSVVSSPIASHTTTVTFPTSTIPSTNTPLSTNTPEPSPTPSYTATNTAVPTSIPTETLTSTPEPINLDRSTFPSGGTIENPIRIFFIRQNTGGHICGDSLVWINTDIPRSGNTVKNITAALTRLFSYRTKYVGDLYNPAYIVSAKVKNVTLSKEGFLFIQLAGSMKERTKDDCENNRLRSQIWSTFRQFKGYDRYDIYLDKARLGDLINTDR
jgi:hypothetical protein